MVFAIAAGLGLVTEGAVSFRDEIEGLFQTWKVWNKSKRQEVIRGQLDACTRLLAIMKETAGGADISALADYARAQEVHDFLMGRIYVS